VECHAAERYVETRHTALGWHLVLLRMQWLNGAAFNPGDHSQLVAHLAEAQGLSGPDAALELAAIGVPLLAFLASWFWLHRRRRGINRPLPPSPG
jgi:hypothetical protein